ncbi:MAG: response regulator transcription factor [Neptuniibacter sp.]
MLSKKFIIADKSPLFSLGLQNCLENISHDFKVSQANTSINLLLENIESFDIAFIDLGLIDLSNVNKINKLIYMGNFVPVIIMDKLSVDSFNSAEKLEAVYFVNKKSIADEYCKIINAIIKGDSPKISYKSVIEVKRTALDRFHSLTRKELEVCRYVLSGYLNKQIAYELNVSESTIKRHITNILDKLKLANRTLLVRFLVDL